MAIDVPFYKQAEQWIQQISGLKKGEFVASRSANARELPLTQSAGKADFVSREDAQTQARNCVTPFAFRACPRFN
jgi:hypothetical protein